MFGIKIWNECVSQYDFHEKSDGIYFVTRRNDFIKIKIDSNIYEYTRR